MESEDFPFLQLLKRVLQALTSEFDDVFDEATGQTTRDEAIRSIRSVYTSPSAGDRDADAVIGDCVRAWTDRTSVREGSESVARSFDIVFIQEEKFVTVRRVGYFS